MTETVLENAFELNMNVIEGITMVFEPAENESDGYVSSNVSKEEYILDKITLIIESMPIYLFLFIAPVLVVFYQRQRIDAHVMFSLLASLVLLWPIAIIHALIIIIWGSKRENLQRKDSCASLFSITSL